ncbi:MAG: 16S rRNA (uracil(1498)-N(3))-methyltransferase [Acidobacteria bacterium]|nr:16S rRNA (uracil(1498)-N(3))-methyltransferase [Acidobacteriota bacterium]
MAFPRIFWPGSAGDSVELTGDAAHHLRQVLRVAPGAAVGLFDGRGHEWAGQIESVSRQSVRVAGLVPIAPVAEARVPVTLAVGVLKGDQMDAVVRDATMLGVAAIVPMQTAHVTVPPRAWQSGAARGRWQRVAVASATQCRRAVVPEVRAVTTFDECVREPAAVRLMCVEPALVLAAGGASVADWRTVPPPASVQILIGPEGGWSSAEVEQALAAGAQPMHLGPRTLRAETTPVVALTMVWATWGW